MDLNDEAPLTDMQVISPAFRNSQPIPEPYSATGKNVNPPLNILSVPDNTQSLALIMHDPDAPMGDFTHWIMWDIPADTETVAANSVPVGAVQGLNDAGELGYYGPQPPSGTHHYMFEVYALDSALSLPEGSSCKELKEAMSGHVLAHCCLTGIFSASHS